MEPKNKKLRFLIIVLAVLLGISATGLTGTILYNHFSKTVPTTVDVPGNIITPEGKSSIVSGKPTTSSALADSSQVPSTDRQGGSSSTSLVNASEMCRTSSVGEAKAKVISLHTKQPEENKPFQATNLFPGDNETEYYCIKVSYKGNIVVRYHADIRPGYEKLAEVLKVRIRLLGSDGFLYDGLMRDMPESLNHALYTTKSTQSELYYEITAYLDTSVGNEYMDKNLLADFRWWVEESDNLDSPKTGDTTNIYLWICFASGSLVLLLILLGKRRKEAADETE